MRPRAAVLTLLLSGGLALLALPSAATAGPFQPKNSKAQDAAPARPATQAPAETVPAQPPPAASSASDSPAAPAIPLRGDLRMLIRPTILGLVPNPDPDGFGEMFARVLAVEGGRARLYFEVKELVENRGPQTSWLASLRDSQQREASKAANVTGSDTGVPDPSAAGAQSSSAPVEALAEDDNGRALDLSDFGRLIQQTRIRRGEINFGGLDSSARSAPPLFWGDGPWQAQGSGLWVSRGVYQKLKSSGQADWDLSFEMASVRQQENSETPATGPAQLVVIGAQARYPCVVNGARVMLPALHCHDSLGMAEYWVLDDPENPLLLKLSFLPPEGLKPIESLVELDSSDSAGAEGRDPRRPKLLVRDPEEDEDDEDDTGQQHSYGSSPAGNQFGGQPRAVPPDLRSGPPQNDSPSQPGNTTRGKGTQASAEKDLGSYLPPTIGELIACGGGYAIVEIDF